MVESLSSFYGVQTDALISSRPFAKPHNTQTLALLDPTVLLS